MCSCFNIYFYQIPAGLAQFMGFVLMESLFVSMAIRRLGKDVLKMPKYIRWQINLWVNFSLFWNFINLAPSSATCLQEEEKCFLCAMQSYWLKNQVCGAYASTLCGQTGSVWVRHYDHLLDFMQLVFRSFWY